VVATLGGLAASAALGQSVPVPIPTVSTPTVSVPTVTVPSVTVPPVTTPAPGPSTPPVSTPPATTPSVQASAGGAVAGGSGGNSGGGSAGSTGASGGSSSSFGASASSGASAAGGSSGPRTAAALPSRLHSTRTWIAVHGSKQRRATTLTFRLERNGIVQFTVMEVSPVCRFVGTLRVRGHSGVNRVRFGGRVHGVPLSAGTYRISARTRAGTVVAVTTLVVVDAGAPSPAKVAAARHSNVCGSNGILGAVAARGSFAAGAEARANEEASTVVRHQRSSGKPSQTPSGGDNNPRSVAVGPLSDVGGKARSPIVIVLLGLAVTMLGLAALPRGAVDDPRLLALIASHRLELVTAGISTLFAAVVAMLLV
jgi:hypothetical protein